MKTMYLKTAARTRGRPATLARARTQFYNAIFSLPQKPFDFSLLSSTVWPWKTVFLRAYFDSLVDAVERIGALPT